LQGIFPSWCSKNSSIESANLLSGYSTSQDLQRR